MGNWGGEHSDETKNILRLKKIGNIPWNKNKKTGPLSESHKIKISKKTKGRNNPMFGKTKENSPIYGIKKTKNHKLKLSESKKFGNNPNSIKYHIITPDHKEIIVNSATEFIEKYPEYNINRHFIYSASNSGKDNYKGWNIKKC